MTLKHPRFTISPESLRERSRNIAYGLVLCSWARPSASGRVLAHPSPSGGCRTPDQVVEGRQRGLSTIPHGDDDLFEGHRGAVPRRKDPGH